MPLLTLKFFILGLAYVALWLAFYADWQIDRAPNNRVVTKKHLKLFNIKNRKL